MVFLEHSFDNSIKLPHHKPHKFSLFFLVFLEHSFDNSIKLPLLVRLEHSLNDAVQLAL